MNRPYTLHNVFPPLEPGFDTKGSSNPNGKGLPLIRALLPRGTATCVGQDCPVGSGTPTGLIIGLAAALPIVSCLIALIYLHRRHVKKQRLEDANDRHKSLDFGLDSPPTRKNKHGVPEMLGTGAEKDIRRERGMSMDLSSPFVMPAALQGSRDSIHSLARSVHDNEGPYRPVTLMKDDSASVLLHGRSRPSNLSIYSTSTGSPFDSSNSNLLKNAQRLSSSTPLSKSTTTSSSDLLLPQIQLPEPAQFITRKEITLAGKGAPPPAVTETSLNSRVNGIGNAGNPIPVSAPVRSGRNPTLSPVPSSTLQTPRHRPYDPPPLPLPHAKVYQTDSPVIPSQPQTVTAPRLNSMEASIRNVSSSTASQSENGEAKRSPPVGASEPSNPGWPLSRSTDTMPAIAEHEQPAGLGVHGLGYDLHRSSVGTRPLPPDDANDNPEQRANRIRSFYKEYFDPSKPDLTQQTQRGRTNYYEDYSQEYLNNGAAFDPATGRFVVAQAPYAQPVTRRAMTRPPRAPPRFKGATPGRVSGSSSGTPGQRRFSSASKTPNMGPQGRAPGARKPMPAPAPLQTLPTPHMLREDSMVFSPIDFAPPASYRERQAGRSESPLGEKKPYSPTIKSHTPLASPFVDLAHIPSPHALRNSGSFTTLDFAPIPRFRTSEGGSDAGSVRSNGSGMSAAQLRSMRGGAYRVSRIPKEWVGTRDDLAVSLRPTWDLRG